MPDTVTPKTGADKPADKKPEAAWNTVKLTHPQNHGRIVFRSVSESRARTWLETHFPRGSEAYLETADGKTYHHELERSGDQGADADVWAEFDPATWVPTNQPAPPGQDDWADQEG